MMIPVIIITVSQHYFDARDPKESKWQTQHRSLIAGNYSSQEYNCGHSHFSCYLHCEHALCAVPKVCVFLTMRTCDSCEKLNFEHDPLCMNV